jgi:hypothetical protein
MCQCQKHPRGPLAGAMVSTWRARWPEAGLTRGSARVLTTLICILTMSFLVASEPGPTASGFSGFQSSTCKVQSVSMRVMPFVGCAAEDAT